MLTLFSNKLCIVPHTMNCQHQGPTAQLGATGRNWPEIQGRPLVLDQHITSRWPSSIINVWFSLTAACFRRFRPTTCCRECGPVGFVATQNIDCRSDSNASGNQWGIGWCWGVLVGCLLFIFMVYSHYTVIDTMTVNFPLNLSYLHFFKKWQTSPTSKALLV